MRCKNLSAMPYIFIRNSLTLILSLDSLPPCPLPHGRGLYCSYFTVPPDGGEKLSGAVLCNKESACGGRSSRYSAVTRVA